MTIRMHIHLNNYGFSYLFIYLFIYSFIYLLIYLLIYFIIYLYFIFLKLIWKMVEHATWWVSPGLLRNSNICEWWYMLYEPWWMLCSQG